MATKTNNAVATKAVAKSAGQMVAKLAAADEPEKAEAMAKMAVLPSINAAAVMAAYTKPLGEQDVGSLAEVLQQDMKAMLTGDLSRAEAMLFGQAHALQAIFMNLARRSTTQEYMKNTEAYLRLALKAQSQCRATLEALAEIKNPRPVMFAKQANISNGPQQVNNGAPTESGTVRASGHAHASENADRPNELLEHQHGNHLDTRTQSKAGRADPHLEAVESGYRATNA